MSPTRRASGRESRWKQFDPFVPGEHRGIDQACSDVLLLQPRKTLEDGGGVITFGQHVEHMLDGEPTPPDDRLPAEKVRIAGDAVDEVVLLRGGSRRIIPTLGKLRQ